MVSANRGTRRVALSADANSLFDTLRMIADNSTLCKNAFYATAGGAKASFVPTGAGPHTVTLDEIKLQNSILATRNVLKDGLTVTRMDLVELDPPVRDSSGGTNRYYVLLRLSVSRG